MLRTCAALPRSRPANLTAVQPPDRALNSGKPRAQRVAWARDFSVVASS
ncbi:MAG: hypothetical protein ACFNPU_08840 [Corynebacterium matruchotii]|nr:hypothetical protein [Corynebacterium matruchotii]